MLLILPDNYKDLREFIRVWRNEFTRIICDRLISQTVSNTVHAIKFHLQVSLHFEGHQKCEPLSGSGGGGTFSTSV